MTSGTTLAAAESRLSRDASIRSLRGGLRL